MGPRPKDLRVGESLSRLDNRVHRALKMPQDIEAEVYVDAIGNIGDENPGEQLLEGKAVTGFRGMVARINFLAQDR